MKSNIRSGLRRAFALVLVVCILAGIAPGISAATDTNGARNAIEKALCARADQVELAKFELTTTQFGTVFHEILDSEPAKYWYVTGNYSITTNNSVVNTVTFEYLDEKTYDPKAFRAAVDLSINRSVLSGMSDLEMALAIHEYLALHCSYDPKGGITAYDALVHGTAASQGYAEAYRVLLDSVDIPSILAIGSDGVWNLVKLDGAWYHVDVAADDAASDLPGQVNHAFFLRSDNAMKSAGRSGWEAAESCVHTTYDSGSYWTQANGPVVFPEAGSAVYRTDSNNTITILRHSGGNEIPLYSMDVTGITVGQGTLVHPDSTGLSLYDGSLYFPDGSKVYQLPLRGGSATAVYTHKTSDGNYIHISHVEEGKLSLVLFSLQTLEQKGAKESWLTSDQHAHSYTAREVAATCTREGYYTYSCSCGDSFTGITTTDMLGHSWQSATCTKPRTCSRCEATEGKALGHTIELQNKVEVSCTADGYSGDEVCTVCNTVVTKGSVIAATGHTTKLQGKTAATCTTEGYTGDQVCTVCNKVVVKGETVKKLEHAVSSWTIKEATCTTAGSKSGYCSVCEKDITETIPATGHSVASWEILKEATCTTDGQRTGFCTVCNKDVTEVIPAGHTWGTKVTVNPTCTADGADTWECTVCGERKSEPLPATGHTMGDWAITAKPTCGQPGIESRTCVSCGYEEAREIAALDHTWDEGEVTQEATCTINGKKAVTCTACGATGVQIIKAPGHKTELVGQRDATCTKAGYTGDQICTVCDATVSEGKWIDALGHATVLENVVKPTCTETGYSGDQVCTVCDTLVTKGTIVAATGHTPELRNAKESTCLAEGYTGDSYCAVCDVLISTGTATPISDHQWTLWDFSEKDGYLIRECVTCFKAEQTTVENPFTDLEEDSYYVKPVLWAVANNVTSGTSKTAFSPSATCTRAQVVTFLWRASGSPKPVSNENPFTDVKQGAYYYDAVLWAVENGITSGLDADTFGANNPCTRGQVVTFLHRAAKSPAPSTSDNPFKDVSSREYYYTAVLWAVENNITSGTSKTAFSPNATCTRAQIVTFLYRYISG